MREEPSAVLTDLLARLHLATLEQVQAVQSRARKLARDLPLFDSVWIDALAQVRLLTPFQAAEINAGRGEQLLVGSYVLRRRIQRLGYAECFLAEEINREEKTKTKSQKMVHLVVARRLEPSQAARIAAELQTVVERFAAVKATGIVPLKAAGSIDGTLWAAYDPPSGFPVDEWLSCQGRFSPDAALEIARQMGGALAALEKENIVHGDIAASSLWLTEAGNAQLTRCGMCGATTQHESLMGHATALEMFDYVAPERLLLLDADKLPGADQRLDVDERPSIAGEMFACGALWWHLLAGRPPLVGGNVESKLQAARAGIIPDIRRIAPDVAGTLATAIQRCTQRDPAERPQSFAELESLLGPPSSAGHRLVSMELFRSGRRTSRADWPRRVQSAVQGAGQPLLAATACALLLAAATWPLWRVRHPAAELSKGNSSAVGNELRLPIAQHSLASAEPRRLGDNSQGSNRDLQNAAIRQANYQITDDGSPRSKNLSADLPVRSIVELNGATEIAGGTLRLPAGAIVRGKDGKRPRIAVPPSGLAISVDNVRFENVDFVWRQRPEEIISPDRHALVELRSGQAEFAGCTFQAQAVGSFDLPAAIRVGSNLQRAALAPAMSVRFDGCALRGVACGVECQARGPAAITMRNLLYLGRGPLVRLPQTRRADASTAITLEHITLRGGTAALELNCDDTCDVCGTVVVNTTGCVFAPEESGALVIFSGRQEPKSTAGALAALEWSCQDSLISPGATVAIWQHGEVHQTLPDDALPLEGLVASPFDFVGAATDDPGNSRLHRWLAPMRTDLTPGIGDDLPRLRDMQ